ncbi:MAG: AI-2E family transporter [Acidimicrobiales bacterium]
MSDVAPEKVAERTRLGLRKSTVTERATQWLIVRSSVLVLLAGIVVVLFVLLAWRLRATLLLVALGLFIAALLNPFVRMLHRRGMRRGYAVGVVYAVLVLLALAFGYLVFHPLITNATHFARTLPKLVDQARKGKGVIGHLIVKLHLETWIRKHVPSLQSALTKLSKPAFSVGKTVLSGVVSLVTIAFISFFVLLEGPRSLGAGLDWMNPDHAVRVRRIIDAMAGEVTGFMIGDFATSVVAGIVVFAALEITGVPFATVLAVWVGLVDFLPMVGGLLAGVPTVLVAFLHSIPAGIVTVIVFLVYQQIENHVLYPLIVSRTVRLSPLWVLLAVLIGAETGNILGSTFGAIAGAILAVPAAGSLQVAARELVVERRRERITRPAVEDASA